MSDSKSIDIDNIQNTAKRKADDALTPPITDVQKRYAWSDDAALLEAVIRNIPKSLSQDEIKEELLQLHFPIISVTRLYNKPKNPMPLSITNLVNNEGGKAIFKLEKLLNSIVTVETRKKTRDIP